MRWLQRQSALPMFDLVEVDNADEAALLNWQRHLGTLGGSTDAPALDGSRATSAGRSRASQAAQPGQRRGSRAFTSS